LSTLRVGEPWASGPTDSRSLWLSVCGSDGHFKN
jgi:hypothetical protein